MPSRKPTELTSAFSALPILPAEYSLVRPEVTLLPAAPLPELPFRMAPAEKMKAVPPMLRTPTLNRLRSPITCEMWTSSWLLMVNSPLAWMRRSWPTAPMPPVSVLSVMAPATTFGGGAVLEALGGFASTMPVTDSSVTAPLVLVTLLMGKLPSVAVLRRPMKPWALAVSTPPVSSTSSSAAVWPIWPCWATRLMSRAETLTKLFASASWMLPRSDRRSAMPEAE